MLGLVLRDFRLGPAWPDLGWLFLLAMTSQVIGWLLITMSMSRLPAWLVSALLLIQPVGSLVLGAVFLGERPSLLQVAGAVVILGGVLIAAGGQGRAADPAALPETGLVRGVRPRVPAPCSGAGEISSGPAEIKVPKLARHSSIAVLAAGETAPMPKKP
jgi:hypothetical protein